MHNYGTVASCLVFYELTYLHLVLAMLNLVYPLPMMCKDANPRIGALAGI
jgi:hypothetical protein